VGTGPQRDAVRTLSPLDALAGGYQNYLHLPAAYGVQRTRNIYAYMWVHCTLNTVGILLTLAALLAGIHP
jgi:hypothetical protein